jgi:hypothetical protein
MLFVVLLGNAFAGTPAACQAPVHNEQAAPLQENQKLPPDTVIVRFGWTKERIGWDRDPGPVETIEEMRQRARDERRLEQTQRRRNRADVSQINIEIRERDPEKEQYRPLSDPRYGYRYKLRIKNTGSKVIKAVDWDYVFLSPETRDEIGRHQFTSEEKIGLGQTKELLVKSLLPPWALVSAKQDSGKETPEHERAVIVRIEYADGTVWTRPAPAVTGTARGPGGPS